MRKSQRSLVNSSKRSHLQPGMVPFEGLEPRRMFSASPALIQYTPATTSTSAPLSSINYEKYIPTSINIRDAKNGPMANAGKDLIGLYLEYKAFLRTGGKAADFVSKLENSFQIAGGKVQVTVQDHSSAMGLATRLSQLGANVVSVNGTYKTVTAAVPIEALRRVANLPKVVSINALQRAATASAGSANNQADETELADQARSVFGLDGSGIKIGVLSDSVDFVGDGLGGSIASGDLPKGIQVIQDSNYAMGGGNDEGRAILELIHDLVPKATLAYATAFGGQQNFADNIRALAAAGCKVIVDDVTYFQEPYFQPGVIDQAITDFVEGGGVYLSSAGNSSDGAIQQDINWVNVGNKKYQDFDPGPNVDTSMNVSVAGGFAVLEWDNPYNGITGNATSDVDVFFYDANNPSRLVASGTTNNLLTHLPIESFSLASGEYIMKIQLVSSTQGQPLPTLYKLSGSIGLFNAEYAGVRTTVNGHNGGIATISVGAVPFFAAPPYVSSGTGISSENFSSIGPVVHIFDADGNRLTTPQTILKPDVSGIDGVNTSFFTPDPTGTFPPLPTTPLQGDIFEDPDGFPNFFGTSAAAPNVAAVVAMILQADPTATQPQILSALKASARPLNGAALGEYDPQGGFGLVDAYAAVQQFVKGPTAKFEAVTPNPRATVVNRIKLTFTQQVSGFDVSDLNFHQPGGQNLLTGNNSPVTTDGGRTWYVRNLNSLTLDPGTYIMELNDDDHSVVNAAGVPLTGGATTRFVIQGSNGVPEAPTNLRADTLSPTLIQLHWTDNSFGETGFYIQRSEDPSFKGSTLKTFTVRGDITRFNDTITAKSRPIYYRVRAFGAGNDVSAFVTTRVVSLAAGEVVLDNNTAKRTVVSGPWSLNTSGGGFIGDNYLDDVNSNKGKLKVTYTPFIEKSGDYYIYARWTRANDRATNVPINISINGKVQTITVNQRNTGGNGWVLLGKFNLNRGTSAFVQITNNKTNGRVTADAVRFQPATA